MLFITNLPTLFVSDTSHRDIWNIKVDRDILDTIKDKFPSWFSSTSYLNTVATTSKFVSTQLNFTDFFNTMSNGKSDKRRILERKTYLKCIISFSLIDNPGLISITSDGFAESKMTKTYSLPLELFCDNETRQSPPKAIVDSSPLDQSTMDKNRECKFIYHLNI